MSTFDRYGEALEAARLRAGFKTQSAAAEACRLRQQQLSRYERCDVPPNLTTLGRMLEVYGVTLVEFAQILMDVQGRPNPLTERLDSVEARLGDVETTLERLAGRLLAVEGGGEVVPQKTSSSLTSENPAGYAFEASIEKPGAEQSPRQAARDEALGPAQRQLLVVLRHLLREGRRHPRLLAVAEALTDELGADGQALLEQSRRLEEDV